MQQPESAKHGKTKPSGWRSIQGLSAEPGNLPVSEKRKSSTIIGYLKKFINADKLIDYVYLSFSEDYPLNVKYKIDNSMSLDFILAPRGED